MICFICLHFPEFQSLLLLLETVFLFLPDCYFVLRPVIVIPPSLSLSFSLCLPVALSSFFYLFPVSTAVFIKTWNWHDWKFLPVCLQFSLSPTRIFNPELSRLLVFVINLPSVKRIFYLPYYLSDRYVCSLQGKWKESEERREKEPIKYFSTVLLR